MALFFELDIGMRTLSLSEIKASKLIITMINDPATKVFLMIKIVLLASLLGIVGIIMALIQGQHQFWWTRNQTVRVNESQQRIYSLMF